MGNLIHLGCRSAIRCMAIALVCLAAVVPLRAQSVDWKEGGYARWQNILVSSSKEWDSARDTFSVVLRVFDKVAPIDTVSLLVYYPASITEVQNRPAITIRIDGYKGKGTQIAKATKAFYRTTGNRLASNESGDVATITTTAFDTLNQSVAGSFDVQCTYVDAENSSNNQKFQIRGVFRIRGFVIEPADVGLKQGEAITYRVLTAPGAFVGVVEGTSTQPVIADAHGVASYTRTLSASQAVTPIELSFITSTGATAGASRTIYVDTSFAKPVVLPLPNRRGYQLQACRNASDKRNNRRRAEFGRPENFRAVNYKDSNSISSVELHRLPIDSLHTTSTTATLAGISVKTDIMIAAQTDTVLANRAAADSALVQWLRAKEYRALGAVRDDSVAMKISGGVFNGKTVHIPCRRQPFEKKEERESLDGTRTAALHTVRGEIVALNWGVAPAGVFSARRARGLLLLGVTTKIDQRTSDSSMITLQNPLLLGRIHTGAISAATACDSLNATMLRKVKDSLSGAVPEYLLLYDYTADYTVSPDSIDNINQYDRGASDDLPVRHGYKGGNACGASSLTMALSTLLPVASRPTLSQAYHNSLQIGLRKSDATTASVVPDDTEQAFLWERATRWLWGDTVSTGMCLTNTDSPVYSCRKFNPDMSDNTLDALLRPAYGMRKWTEVDGWLALKRPVLIGTYLGTGVNPGGGHVILLLGVGNNPEVRKMLRSMGVDTNYYIVADPAGHFYANPDAGGMNAGHYGLAGKLDSLCVGMSHSGWFGIYPRDRFRLRAGNTDSTRYTLSFFNDSTVYVRVRSRCTAASNCATNGFGGKVPDVQAGASQEDVPPTLSVVIVDNEGRRTGMNADGSTVQDIPGSEVNIAFGEEEGGDNSNGFEVQLRDALVIGLRNPGPGAYKVEVTGIDETAYDVDIVMHNVAKIAYDHRSERDTVEVNQKKEYDILIPTDVIEEGEHRNRLLRSSYPEPVNSVATVEFALDRPQHVRLGVVNMMGAEVAVLMDGYTDAGMHFARWNTETVPAGVYFCRIEADGIVEVRRITVLR